MLCTFSVASPVRHPIKKTEGRSSTEQKINSKDQKVVSKPTNFSIISQEIEIGDAWKT